MGVVCFHTTAHEVRQRARCHNCGVKGNTTYQIVYAGNSDLTMDGAEATPEKIQKTDKAHKDYMRVPK